MVIMKNAKNNNKTSKRESLSHKYNQNPTSSRQLEAKQSKREEEVKNYNNKGNRGKCKLIKAEMKTIEIQTNKTEIRLIVRGLEAKTKGKVKRKNYNNNENREKCQEDKSRNENKVHINKQN